MFDINAIEPAAAPAPEREREQLAKAHPAAQLLTRPGWTCTVCGHKNPITEPFCEKCPQ